MNYRAHCSFGWRSDWFPSRPLAQAAANAHHPQTHVTVIARLPDPTPEPADGAHDDGEAAL